VISVDQYFFVSSFQKNKSHHWFVFHRHPHLYFSNVVIDIPIIVNKFIWIFDFSCPYCDRSTFWFSQQAMMPLTHGMCLGRPDSEFFAGVAERQRADFQSEP
jgi:hypothetical protein